MIADRVRVGAAGSTLEVSFVTSATSTSHTITIPASATTGDLAVLLDWARSGGIPPIVTPSGFTSVGSDGLFEFSLNVSYKILGPSDPGAVITGMNGSVNDRKTMLIFRGSKPLTAVTVGGGLNAATGSPGSISINASGVGRPTVIVAGAFEDDGSETVAFNTESPAVDGGTISQLPYTIVKYKIYNTAPANHTVEVLDVNGDGVAGFYFFCEA